MSEITLAQLEQALRSAGTGIDAYVAPVIKRTAMKVADTQRELVPTDTGKTRDSIKATGPGGQPFTPTTIEAEIGPTWFVGRFIERGTVRQPPRPFVSESLEPHLEQHAKEIQEAAVAAMGVLGT